MGTTLGGFRRFFSEGEVNSLDPESKKPGEEKDDYLGALDDELGTDWKSAMFRDKVVVHEPMELGNYVYKTSAWKVISTGEDHVTIQLDVAGTPNLVHNVFRKKPDGTLERLTKNGPFDTEPKTVSP
jgi:hypothetical protein